MSIIPFPGNPRPSYFRGEALVIILPVIRIERHEEDDRLERDRKTLRDYFKRTPPRAKRIPIKENDDV